MPQCIVNINHVKFVFLLGIILPNFAVAAFPDLGVGVRPLGMGGAYIAVSDDSNATFWNAAGLTQIQSSEFTASYSILYAGLNAQLFNQDIDQLGYHFVSYAQPIGSPSNVVATSFLFFDSAFYQEQTYLFSFAKQIWPAVRGGMNAKYLRTNVTETPYITANPFLAEIDLTQSATTIDLSLFYAYSDHINLGITGHNLLPADIGVLETMHLPIKVGFGAAHKTQKYTQAIDFIWRQGRINGQPIRAIRFGLERWFLNRQIGVRTGYNVDSATVGASVAYGETYQIQLDYAFIYPISSITDTMGSHRFGFSIRF